MYRKARIQSKTCFQNHDERRSRDREMRRAVLGRYLNNPSEPVEDSAFSLR